MENTIKLITAFFCVFIANSLHLQLHQQTNNLHQFRTIEQGIVASIKTVKQNQEENNKQLLLLKETDEKIKLLQAYLANQRNILLKAYNSTQNIVSTSYTCPLISNSDSQAFSSFNQNIKSQFVNLNNTASNASLANQLPTLLPLLEYNNLPITLKSTQVNSDEYKIQNNTNINYGNFALGRKNVQSITDNYANQQVDGKYNVVCPQKTPFANEEGQCVSCPTLRPYFLVDNLTCISCSQYNESSRQCLDADGKIIYKDVFFTNFNAGNNQILLPEGQNLNQYTSNSKNLQECPPLTPFSKGSVCIACQQGLLYSLKDKICQTCPQWKRYNVSTHNCQAQNYFSNLNSLQWQTKELGIDDILENITIKRSDESYISCPLQEPFAAKEGCISCQNGTHFHYDTLSCTNCSNTTKLDLNEHRCVQPGNLNFQTNPLNTTNLVYNGKSQNQWMNIYYQNIQKYSGITDCPQERPNFDGLACIDCPHSHPYFNMQLLVCQVCQGTTLYDQQQHECVNDSDNRPIQTPSWEKMAAIVFSK